MKVIFRFSFLIRSAASSRARRIVLPLPSPMIVLSLISLTAWAAALIRALSVHDMVLDQPSVSICSRRSMALSTSSRIVSNRSSALFLGFSFAGRSFGGFVAGAGGVFFLFFGSEGVGIFFDILVSVCVFLSFFLSIFSIFSSVVFLKC